jgi:hypothetical protein
MQDLGETAGAVSAASGMQRLQHGIGNRTLQKMLAAGAIQPSLRIGQPNDEYEQEADRVAEQVMRMPEPGLQRKPG